jgi:hypothetical protein
LCAITAPSIPQLYPPSQLSSLAALQSVTIATRLATSNCNTVQKVAVMRVRTDSQVVVPAAVMAVVETAEVETVAVETTATRARANNAITAEVVQRLTLH